MLDARDVDFVPSRHAAVVTDGSLDAVFLIGLATGTRAPLSGAGAGSGPSLLDPQGIAVDESRNRVLVLDAERRELTAIDLTTGARFTLSSDSVGSGPALGIPQRIALDPFRDRALVTVRFFLTAVLAVDLATGDRSVLSGTGRGTGPSFVAPLDVLFDPFQDRVLVADPGASALFEVDPITGARAVLSSPSQGVGPTMLRPTGVALDLGGMPLLVDSAQDAVIEVEAMSGDRRTLTRVAAGAGPQLSRPSGLASGLTEPDRLAVADESGVFAVALAGGARTRITGRTSGSGPSESAPVDVVVSTSTPAECLTMLDAGQRAVVDVNRFNGGQTLISGSGVGLGPAFAGPRRMALESGATLRPCASSALVADKPFFDPGSILRVDFATGDRSVLSAAGHGVGPLLIDPVAIVVDGILEVAHVLDAGSPQQILSIDLATGDRTRVFEFVGHLAGPTDLAFGRARGSFTQGRFLVTLADARAVVAASTTFPSMTTVSDARTGSGPLFGRPVALELLPSATVGQVPSRPIAYVADALRGAIVAVDTVTGDRVILSK